MPKPPRRPAAKLSGRIVIVIGLIIGLSGAASLPWFSPARPLSNAAARGLAGKSVLAIRYPAAHLSASTSSNMWLWGPMGSVFAGSREGKDIERDNGIEDPQPQLSTRLLRQLARERRMRPVTDDSPPEQNASLDAPALAALHPGVDYLFDVQMIQVEIQYYPLDWTHYYLQFTAQVRLIEVSSQSAVAQGTCLVKQENEPEHPTKDQLLADHGALLKQLQAAAIESCDDLISSHVLGLT